jgi:hypothetical protein
MPEAPAVTQNGPVTPGGAAAPTGTAGSRTKATLKIEIGDLDPLTLVGMVWKEGAVRHIDVGFEEVPLALTDIAHIETSLLDAQKKLKELGTPDADASRKLADLRNQLETSARSAALSAVGGLTGKTISFPKILASVQKTFTDFNPGEMIDGLLGSIPGASDAVAPLTDALTDLGSDIVGLTKKINDAIRPLPEPVRGFLGGQAAISKLVIQSATYEFGFRIEYPPKEEVTEVDWYPGPPNLLGVKILEFTLDVAVARTPKTTPTGTTPGAQTTAGGQPGLNAGNPPVGANQAGVRP